VCADGIVVVVVVVVVGCLFSVAVVAVAVAVIVVVVVVIAAAAPFQDVGMNGVPVEQQPSPKYLDAMIIQHHSIVPQQQPTTLPTTGNNKIRTSHCSHCIWNSQNRKKKTHSAE
jgi:Na+(H+)/acetate symporter ActP